MRMLHNGKLKDKKILLIEKEAKINNDRTWCFWEQGQGFFENLVYKKWDRLIFNSKDYNSALNISPYQYKMIRGIDLYQYCFKEIALHSNVDIVYGELTDWKTDGNEIVLMIDNQEWRHPPVPVFNSLYKSRPSSSKTIRLLQHFKGWKIQTDRPAFDPAVATIMDFRVSQHRGTTFTYVLPFSETEALIEYTLFTKEILTEQEYEEELKKYITQFLSVTGYAVTEKEFGVIPMSNESFRFYRDGFYYIGTAGGQTKASSGYTFQFIQKQSQHIVDQIITGRPLADIPQTPRRFRFYDNTLLDILYHHKLPGDMIFTKLFKKNEPRQVLRFLDNESTLKEELKIISSLPTWPFLKAALKQL